MSRPVEGLRADEARLALRVVGARLDRDRDGLLVVFVGVVLLCVAAAVYFLADLLVAAAPVVMLASFVAVPRLTSNASRGVVGQWGGAGGAICEDPFALARRLCDSRGGVVERAIQLRAKRVFLDALPCPVSR